MGHQGTHGSRNVVLSKKFFYSQRLPNVDVAGLVQVFGEVDYNILDQFYFLYTTRVSSMNMSDNQSPLTPEQTLEEHLGMVLVQGAVMSCDMLEQTFRLTSIFRWRHTIEGH